MSSAVRPATSPVRRGGRRRVAMLATAFSVAAAGLVVPFASSVVSADDQTSVPSTEPTTVVKEVVSSPLAGAGELVSLDPARVLESRDAVDAKTIDGLFEGDGRVAAGSTVTLDVVGRGGVPADGVSAVVMNVTAIVPSGRGFVTVFPCGEQPLASSLNFDAAGVVVGNELVAKLNDAGQVCLFTSAETHLTVDVVGYVPDSSSLVSLDPARVFESRDAADAKTVDGLFEGDGRVAAGSTVTVDIAGRGGVPANGVSAAVMNVTAIVPSGRGFVTVFPCGEQPLASSLNYDTAGAVVGNELIAKLDADGQVCLFTSGETHLTIDVVGYVPESSTVVSLDPARVLESRDAIDAKTVDGLFEGDGRVAAGSTVTLDVVDRGGVPAVGVSAVVMNVTAIVPSGRGFVTVFPCGEQPLASSLNYDTAGAVVGNELIAKLNDAGQVCLFSSAETHLTVDVVGFVPVAIDLVPGTLDAPVMTEGWHVEPSHVTFTEDGGSESFELVHYDAAGERSGRSVPSGVTLTRANEVFDVRLTGTGVQVVGGTTIGTEFAGLVIPGEDDPVSFWINSVRLEDGVEYVAEADIAFPPPVGTEISDVAPFSVDEFAERFHPEEDDLDKPIYQPYVLRGRAPPVGALLSGNNLGGRVIEPDGLASIERDGLALVTLEIVRPFDLFAEIDVDMDYGQMWDAGLIENNLPDIVCYGFEQGQDAECDAAAAEVASFNASLTDSAFGIDVANTSAALPPLLSGCEGSLGARLGSVDIKVSPNFDVLGRTTVTRTNGRTGDLAEVRVSGGLSATPTATLSGKVDLTVGAKIECKLAELGELTIPATGPLSYLLTGLLEISAVAFGEVTIGGGGSLTVDGVQCSMGTSSIVGGISYDAVADSYSPVKELTLGSPSCGFAPPTELRATGDAGTAIQVEFKVGGGLKGAAGIQIGGYVAEIVGALIRQQDLGEIKPFAAVVGPVASAKLENAAQVIQSKANSTGVGLSLDFTAGLDEAEITSIFGRFLPTNVVVNLPIPQFTASQSLGSLYDAPSSTPFEVSVENEVVTGPASMAVDEKLNVTTSIAEGGGLEANSTVETYETTDGAPASTDEFDWTESGGGLTSNFTMTEAKCADFAEERTFVSVGYMQISGTSFAAVPVYLGEFTVQCSSNVGFVEPGGPIDGGPKSYSVDLSEGSPEAMSDLVQEGFDDAAWFLGDSTDPLVTIDPQSGTFTGERTPLTVSLDCGDDEEAAGSVVFKPTIAGKEQNSSLTANYDCAPEWIEVSPGAVNAPGAVTVTSDGIEDDSWTASGSGISYISPASGSLFAGSQSSSIISVFDPRTPPECGQTLDAENYSVTLTTATRGSATFSISLPALDGPGTEYDGEDADPCDEEEEEEEEDEDDEDDDECLGCGDPHMRTFDGLRYDAQVLGEYVYARTADRSVQIIARHQSTGGNTTEAFGATTIAAVALQVEGRLIEAYAQDIGLQFRVDGEVVVLEPGVPTDFGDGIRATRLDDRVVVRAGGMRVSFVDEHIPVFAPYLDLMFADGEDVELVGMLGSNDGDSSNDLIGSDGIPITLAEARVAGDDFEQFTDSWRITDPAESPFTLASPDFDAPNPPRPTPEELAPYRAQAVAEFGGIQTVCPGDIADGEYIVDLLALELAIGSPPEDLVRYSCAYAVTGTVTADVGGESVPVESATVEVDAVGLEACTTVTGRRGGFACILTPDLAEVGDGSSISFPLPFDIDVVAPGSSAIAASTTGAFASQDASGNTVSSDNDIVLDGSTLTAVELSGNLTSYGAPVTGRTTFSAELRDGFGAVLVRSSVGVDPDDAGDYTTTFVVPADADSIEIVWNRGLQQDPKPTTQLTGLATGLNTFTFDAGYNPPLIRVTGEARVNGAAPGEVLVTMLSTQPDGSVVETSMTTDPNPTTGTYSAARSVPLATTSVEVRVEVVGSGVEPVLGSVGSPVAGPNDLTIDLIADVPLLDVSGVTRLNDLPIFLAVPFEVVARNAGGDETTLPASSFTTVDDEYDFRIALPADAVEATITALIGPDNAHPTIEVDALQLGTNAVDFDAVARFPVLDISGTVTAGADPLDDTFRLVLDATSPETVHLEQNVQPDDEGAFATDFDLPAGTTDATLVARVGFGESDWLTLPLSGLVDGSNTVDASATVDAAVLDIVGVLSEAGTPVNDRRLLRIRMFAGDGSSLGSFSHAVVPEDGAFETRVIVDDAVASVTVATRTSEFSFGRAAQTFTGIVPGLNDITFVDDFDPPVLDLTGSFTAAGERITGVHEFELAVDYVNGDSNNSTANLLATAFLSPVDGSYSFSRELPETATGVSVTAIVGPDPADYPVLRLDGLVDGSNAADFTVDLDEPVSIALDSTLTVDGDPFDDATEIDYRAFDGLGLQIGSTETLAIDPDVSGMSSDEFELPNEVRRVEIAWTGTPGPTYQSFVVSPGDNPVSYVADSENVSITVTGVVTDDGAPFTEPTSFDVVFKETPFGSQLSSIDIDVTPNAAGEYTFDSGAVPTAALVDISWNDGFGSSERFFVNPGDNDIVYDAEVEVFGPQSIVVSGVASIGGEAWLDEINFTLRLTPRSGSQFSRFFNITPNPSTGEYTFSYTPNTAIRAVDVRSSIAPTLEFGDVERSGQTDITYDIDVVGQQLLLSGNVLENGAPIGSARLGVYDPASETTRTRFISPDGLGDYTTEYLWTPEATELHFGLSTGDYTDDVLYNPVAESVGGGYTTITGLSSDIVPPVADVTGTLTRNGSPVTDPVTVSLTWIDDDPFVANTVTNWTRTVTATPDGTGLYAVSVAGPQRADRVLVDVEVGAVTAARQIEITDLAPGSNSALHDITFAARALTVDGTIFDGDEVPWFDVPILFNMVDSADEIVGVADVAVEADSVDGTYEVTIDMPDTTVTVEMITDLTDLEFSEVEVLMNPALIITNEIDVSDGGGGPGTGSAAAGIDVETTFIEITGTVLTEDGEARANESFGGYFELYDADDAPIGVLSLEDEFRPYTNSEGTFTVRFYLPEDTASGIFFLDAAGVDPVAVSDISPGSNAAPLFFQTAAYRLLTVNGQLALNGATPPTFSGRDVSVAGFQAIDTPNGIQLVNRWNETIDFNYSGIDGTGSRVLVMPPEVDVVEVEAIFYDGSRTRHHRYADFSDATGPFVVELDIDDRDDLVRVSGVATVSGDGSGGVCSADGQPFLFDITVRGYTGDPTDPGTPAPTVLLDQLVVPSRFNTSDNGVLYNWNMLATGLTDITHVDVAYSTADITFDQDANFVEQRDPVEYLGGELWIVDDFTANCTP